MAGASTARRLRDDIAQAVRDAHSVCSSLEAHLDLNIFECHVTQVGSAHPSALAGRAGAPPLPLLEDHAFVLSNTRLPLPDDYGPYTYVIFPARLDRDDADRRERYRRLLSAIVVRTVGAAYSHSVRARVAPRAAWKSGRVPRKQETRTPTTTIWGSAWAAF